MKSLTPVYKWTGGKRRELETLKPFYPKFVTSGEAYTFVEPFFGGGAAYWDLNNISGNNIINEYDPELVNFLNIMKTQHPKFVKELKTVEELFKTGTYEEKQNKYYYWRNLDRNNGLTKLSNIDRAIRFYILAKLAFSGMRRFNKNGEFNVPMGNYKNFNPGLAFSKEHISLLKNTKIMCGDYSQALPDTENTFIFLDPPYTRVFNEYSEGNSFGEPEQRLLADRLKNLKQANWLIVIDKSDLTMELYSEYVKHIYAHQYNVNIKNRFDQKVEHIVATNYTV